MFSTSLEGRRRELVDERGIDVDDDSLVLKREISSSGRGRAWVNGSPVTATVLAEIGRQLVNLHGQHDAQTLLDGRVAAPDSRRVWRRDSQSTLLRAAHIRSCSACAARLRR